MMKNAMRRFGGHLTIPIFDDNNPKRLGPWVPDTEGNIFCRKRLTGFPFRGIAHAD
jgi:hypothetical protein